MTMMRWVHFAHAWGFGGLDAVNLYPVLAPKPADCRAWYEAGGHAAALATNIESIVRVAKGATMIVACWGAIATDPNYVESILQGVSRGSGLPNVNFYAFGATANGSPIHVMARGKHRVPDDAKPVLWRTV